MAFADPQAMTINSASESLPRMGSSEPNRVGIFRTADQVYELSIRQNQSSNRFRREVRLTQKKDATDPYSALVKEVSASVIITIDEPKWGFSDEDHTNLITALTAWFNSSAQSKLLAGEN